MSNDIIPTPQSGALSTENLSNVYEQYAQAYAQTERRAGSSISMRNGIMSVSETPLPGNQMAAIVLDAARLNTFYTVPFNSQQPAPPTCYAISRDEASLAPHPDMAKAPTFFQPQAQTCLACPHNQFGTSRTGVGKACSNRRRLLLLPAGIYQQSATGWQLQPYTDVQHYAESPLLTLTIAPTSAKSWGAFVRDAADNYHRPPFGMIVRIYLYMHEKHGKEAIGFETLAPVPDEWAPTILKRHEEATHAILEGFEAPVAQQPGGGFHQAQQQIQGS